MMWMTSDAIRQRVLVFAPIGRDAFVSSELLSRVGIRTEICATLERFQECINSGGAAALVAEEALFGKDIAQLAAWVENKPAWSDLPFVILTSHVTQSAVADWRIRLV